MPASEKMGLSPADQRQHPRYEVTAYVDFGGSELLLYHKIENISLGGICIHSSAIEECGTIVDLIINFPDFDSSISVQGEVVWSNREAPADMGIRYLNLQTNHREMLRQYINLTKRVPDMRQESIRPQEEKQSPQTTTK